MATTSSTSPSITVTADGLAHALDKMGLTESVSAASLYDTILQLQSPPRGNAIPQTAKEGSSNQSSRFGDTTRPGPDFFDPVRVEYRRKMREMRKVDFPNGVP